jgi:hypothetical protein
MYTLYDAWGHYAMSGLVILRECFSSRRGFHLLTRHSLMTSVENTLWLCARHIAGACSSQPTIVLRTGLLPS